MAALRYSRDPVQAVLTDNALGFTMRYAAHAERTPLFAKTCAALGLHSALIRPHRPQTNGTVARFFRTVTEACDDRVPFRDPHHRAVSLEDFVRSDKHDRPPLSLGGLTPIHRREPYFTLSTMS